MRHLVALALLFPTLATAAELVPSVPEQFRGTWNAHVADCGTGDNESALQIDADAIAYYESDGPVKAVVTHGRYEIALIIELSGEGETWLTTEHFKLSPGEDKLTSVNQPGEGFVRYRCPVSGK